MLDIAPKVKEKKRHQSDHSVHMEITFSKEQMELIEQAKAALSHSLPSPSSMAESLAAFAKVVLQKKGLTESSRPRKSPDTAKVAVSSVRSRTGYVSLPLRRQIFRRDKCCQWRDPKTGRICGSKFHPQIDHIQSIWAGGRSEPENLRLLCGIHNRLKYKREAGITVSF
jgi:5-methylcytosine-specific restriction endonuclease McrA